MLLERGLRLGAAALLALALVRVLTRGGTEAARVVRRFATAPAPAVRDELAALARAGRRVSWSGGVAALAAAAEPAREPGDRWRLTTVSAGAVLVRDALGPLDSLPAGGGTLTTRTPRDAWRVTAAAGDAGARPGGRRAAGRVAVFGRAGWEAKFVIAALEEEGWGVDARLTLGDQAVEQGDPRVRNDRHAAVIVLDTSARDATWLVRYVRAGGGLVLAGEGAAWRAEAVRAIAPSRSTRLEAPETREVAAEPLHALPLHVLTGVRADALVLESRDDLAAVAARRERAGRVVQSGFAETWRWRMQGEGSAVRDHRVWWSGLVGAAAAEMTAGATAGASLPAAAVARPTDPAGAPLAELVHALGAASESAGALARDGPALPAWLGLSLLALLVAEWGARRARGAA